MAAAIVTVSNRPETEAKIENVRNRRRLTGCLLCRTSLALEGTGNASQKLYPQARRKPSPDPRHQFERVEYLRSCCLPPQFLTLSRRCDLAGSPVGCDGGEADQYPWLVPYLPGSRVAVLRV